MPTEEELTKALAQTLPEWRRLNGLSQVMLANKAEISPLTIMSIENERRIPRPSTLRRIARALDIEVRDLYQVPASPLA